ncbi:MAG: hypothetical protein E7354_02850 [Clostridiales bacterium]|nr:hypothetical protein [Clostridiales bacterium]
MELNHVYRKTQLHKVISSDVKAGMLSHCYLLSGVDDIIINSFATLLAKEIYCLSDDAPCNECLNCNKISHSNMVDLITYPKGDKGLMVDDMNEIVVDCFVRPVESKYKIYILKNFEECTVQAQNKILKTLEEPPQNVIFILTTTNIGMVLPTICSRAKKVDVPILEKSDIVEILKGENIAGAEDLASLSNCNLTTALILSKSKDTDSMVTLAFDMLTNLNTSADILKYSSRVVALKKNVPVFLDLLSTILRDAIVEEKYRNFLGRENYFDVLRAKYSSKSVSKIVSHIATMFLRLDFNCNVNGLIDELLLKILEVRFLCQ